MLSDCKFIDDTCKTCVSGGNQCSINYLADAFGDYLSSSWHVFTNFPETNLRKFSTKFSAKFVLIFSDGQNWKKAFLYLEILVKTIGRILFGRLVKTCHELSNYFVHQIKHPILNLRILIFFVTKMSSKLFFS